MAKAEKEKRRSTRTSVAFTPETTATLKEAVAKVGAASISDLMRVAARKPVWIVRAYVEGLREEIDARLGPLEAEWTGDAPVPRAEQQPSAAGAAPPRPEPQQASGSGSAPPRPAPQQASGSGAASPPREPRPA